VRAVADIQCSPGRIVATRAGETTGIVFSFDNRFVRTPNESLMEDLQRRFDKEGLELASYRIPEGGNPQ
jgi:hypothetical protein